jgi:hypothetical protein
MRDRHNHFVKKLSRALDYVEMTIGDRIEAAGINCASHRAESRRGTVKFNATSPSAVASSVRCSTVSGN